MHRFRNMTEGETTEGKTVHIENPTAALEEKRNKGLLKLVTEEDNISSRRIETESLLETRMERGEINRGNLVPGTAENYEEWEALKQKVFFHEYLLRYLGRYGQEKQDSPLWYQTEYVRARIMILTIEGNSEPNIRYQSSCKIPCI